MPTIDHSARSAQYRRALLQPLHTLRAASLRLALLAVVASAVYLPGAVVAQAALATAHAPNAMHLELAVRPQVQCPGLSLPC